MRIAAEWYNKNAGQFYKIKQSLKKAESPYQKIELVETDEFGKALLLDGFLQVGEKNEYEYHEPMVHFPMLAHPAPETILIIGGGDGGILREVYKHPSVKTVDFVDLDKDVVEFSREYLPQISAGAFERPETNIIIGDGRKFVFSTDMKYDVIIMDMTDPFGPSAMLYTQEFYAAVKNLFKTPESLFIMHSESPVARPQAFGCIRQTLEKAFSIVKPVYTYVQMYGTLWSYAVASEKTDISQIEFNSITEKIKNNPQLQNSHMINADSYQAMQVEYPWITKLLQGTFKIITDKDSEFPDLFEQTQISL